MYRRVTILLDKEEFGALAAASIEHGLPLGALIRGAVQVATCDLKDMDTAARRGRTVIRRTGPRGKTMEAEG